MPDGYGGQGFSPRGEKGRYVLPSDFRKAIAPDDNAPRVLCLVKHDRWNCLSAFGLDVANNVRAILDDAEHRADKLGLKFDRELRAQQLLNHTKVTFDSSGRFILPDYLGQLCGMDGSIAFLGGSPFFTLWAPQAIYAMGEGFEAQQAMVRSMEADAAKAKRK